LAWIDEYLFVVAPLIAGEGKGLFEGEKLPQKCQSIQDRLPFVT